MSWKPDFNRIGCPYDATTVGHKTWKKTKPMVVYKPGKVEIHNHITDNQSWNSCHKVASDHEFVSGSAKEPTKKRDNAP